jgi:hypothetical protein
VSHTSRLADSIPTESFSPALALSCILAQLEANVNEPKSATTGPADVETISSSILKTIMQSFSGLTGDVILSNDVGLAPKASGGVNHLLFDLFMFSDLGFEVISMADSAAFGTHFLSNVEKFDPHAAQNNVLRQGIAARYTSFPSLVCAVSSLCLDFGPVVSLWRGNRSSKAGNISFLSIFKSRS